MSANCISSELNLNRYGIGGTSDFMSEDDALKLSDAFSIVSAACCIVGVAPSLAKGGNDVTAFHLRIGQSPSDAGLPSGQTELVVKAICTAITTGKLKPVHLERPDVEGVGEAFFNIWKTLIDIDELKRWLLSRNCKPAFFFGTGAINTPDYLENKHPNFSSEIAAAIRVWEAIQDPELLNGKSVKGAATEWLKTNYRDLGLIHHGKRSNSAIDRIATLVNWETGGGAPKTPG